MRDAVGRMGNPVSVTLESVQSSTIKAVGYDPQSEMLVVEFHNGGTYLYAGVGATTHQALMAAPSLGSYLHSHVKPRHTVSKLPPSPVAP